jgi:hypothetical protein
MDLQQFLNRPPVREGFPGQEYLRKRLVSKLEGLNNLAIEAHTGWGKQMLLKDVGFQLLEMNQSFRLFYFDLRQGESMSSFLRRFALELCASTSTPPPQTANKAGPDLKLLELPETIARKRKIKLILFLSNFQLARGFENYSSLLRKCKLCWRKHLHCAYCLSGTGPYIFKELFGEIGSPFHGFGRLYLLYKTMNMNCLSYINSLFLNGHKMIEPHAAKSISYLTENHLFYLQRLCWHAFIHTDQNCTLAIVEEAFKNLICHYDSMFEKQLMGLTQMQFNYLRSLIDGTYQICSRESLRAYDLGSSGHVARIRESLARKGILEISPYGIQIIDPLFKHSLVRYCQSYTP